MATCNMNVIVVLDFISRDLYLLFAICFSSKFQNSVFYQHMRPKSGLKFPRPFRSVHLLCLFSTVCVRSGLKQGKCFLRFQIYYEADSKLCGIENIGLC